LTLVSGIVSLFLQLRSIMSSKATYLVAMNFLYSILNH